MADPEITTVQLEVLEFKEMLVCVDGQGEQSAWLHFAIRQPGYPRTPSRLPIYVDYKQDIDPNSQRSLGDNTPEPKSMRTTISDDAVGTLYVRRQKPSDSLCPPPDMGLFSYWQAWKYQNYSEKESFDIQLHLIDSDFERLQKWALAGQYPSMVTIYTPDIYHTWSGDYRILEWQASGTFADDAMSAHAAISRVAFHHEIKPLAVNVADNEEQFEREARLAKEVETRQAVMYISERTAAIEADLRAIGSSIAFVAANAIWVILIVIAINTIAVHFAEHHSQ